MNTGLADQIKSCPNLPSLPALAVQVLDLAQKPDVDITEIARIISKDPALSSKILKTVNSSFYGRSNNVSTISQALVILGLQSVKSLVLGFSLVNNLSKNKAKAFQHIVFWKRAIFSATAARILAAKVNLPEQEEAFLGALLMDLGMLVLDLCLPDQYSEIYSKAASHYELAKHEAAALGATHAEVAGMLTQHWKLPPSLHVPVGHHDTADAVSDPQMRKLTDVIALAGCCADVFIDENPATAIATVRTQLQLHYSIDEAAADALLSDIGTRTKEVAKLFEINIGSTQDFEAVLKKANNALVELTLVSQQQTSQLQVQNDKLREQVTHDGLTSLANRAAFDQFIATRFETARANRESLSLLMMDLDKFKSINDKYGHPAGDATLKSVAKLLGTAARKQDLAARFGGEEMVLVLPQTTRAAAAMIAETIRRAIAARPIICGLLRIPITTSIGLATFQPGSPFREAGHLLKAADLALYNAKRSGRNCVKIFSLPTPGVPAKLAA